MVLHLKFLVSMARPARLLFALLALLTLTGCLFRSHRVERQISSAVLRQATRDQLVDQINAQADKIQTLDATVDIFPSVGGSKKGVITEFDTPNLDRFARRSVRFTQHYSGALPCMPARHDLLVGALDFLWRPWGSIELWEEAITVALRGATGSRYRVIRRRGGGGMADDYFAEQAVLARRVVIKVLHAHLGKDPEIAERFRREARL